METERLTLRHFTATDVDNLVALDSDPVVMRYLNGGGATPRDVIERDILPGFIHSYALCAGCGVWAVTERTSAAFLGWVSLRPREGHPGEATLGYRLRRSAWGQGFATEAARALIGVAFHDTDIRRVTATTYQDNRASRRVMEKLGMTLARTFRYTPADLATERATYIPGQSLWEGDDVEYALERSAWERMEAHRTR